MDQVLDREPPPGGRGLRSLRRGTVLKKGDRIVAIGTGVMLEQFEQIVRRRSDEDLLQAPGVTSSRVVVISKRALGKTAGELPLDHFVLRHRTAEEPLGKSGTN